MVQLDDLVGQVQAEPVPAATISGPLSRTRKNFSSARAWSSGAIPMPVSRTAITTSPSVSSAASVTLPPRWLYLIALPSRLFSAIRNRSLSTATAATSRGTCRSSRTPLLSARDWAWRKASRSRSSSFTRWRSGRMLPISSLFTLSRLLMSEFMRSTSSWITLTASTRVAASAPSPASTSPYMPITFSGDLSSCDTCATKSLAARRASVRGWRRAPPPGCRRPARRSRPGAAGRWPRAACRAPGTD